jgi:hypothetical protein
VRRGLYSTAHAARTLRGASGSIQRLRPLEDHPRHLQNRATSALREPPETVDERSPDRLTFDVNRAAAGRAVAAVDGSDAGDERPAAPRAIAASASRCGREQFFARENSRSVRATMCRRLTAPRSPPRRSCRTQIRSNVGIVGPYRPAVQQSLFRSTHVGPVRAHAAVGGSGRINAAAPAALPRHSEHPAPRHTSGAAEGVVAAHRRDYSSGTTAGSRRAVLSPYGAAAVSGPRSLAMPGTDELAGRFARDSAALPLGRTRATPSRARER